jgi:CopG family nickel-responsive transcriptional regulator
MMSCVLPPDKIGDCRHPGFPATVAIFAPESQMQRLTISIEDELAEAFEQWITAHGYANRSEAIRDLMRRELGETRLAAVDTGSCIAVLSYVYDHHERQLAARLTDLQHDQHHLTVATMHAHLDHENCIESAILRGETRQVRDFASAMVAETGVHHGNVHLIAVEPPLNKRWRRVR